MDYERLMVDYLNSLGLGMTAYHDVPSSRPAEFMVVELTGGGSDSRFASRPSVDVDCWAMTRARAAEIADSVIAATRDMPDRVTNVFGTSISSTYDNPDLESGTPRYTVGVEMTAND